MHKNKRSASTTSTEAAATSNSLGHSQEQRDLMITAEAIPIDLDLSDYISFLHNFFTEDDFSD